MSRRQKGRARAVARTRRTRVVWRWKRAMADCWRVADYRSDTLVVFRDKKGSGINCQCNKYAPSLRDGSTAGTYLRCHRVGLLETSRVLFWTSVPDDGFQNYNALCTSLRLDYNWAGLSDFWCLFESRWIFLSDKTTAASVNVLLTHASCTVSLHANSHVSASIPYSLFLYFPVEPDKLFIRQFAVSIPVIDSDQSVSLLLIKAQLVVQNLQRGIVIQGHVQLLRYVVGILIALLTAYAQGFAQYVSGWWRVLRKLWLWLRLSLNIETLTETRLNCCRETTIYNAATSQHRDVHASVTCYTFSAVIHGAGSWIFHKNKEAQPGAPHGNWCSRSHLRHSVEMLPWWRWCHSWWKQPNRSPTL